MAMHTVSSKNEVTGMIGGEEESLGCFHLDVVLLGRRRARYIPSHENHTKIIIHDQPAPKGSKIRPYENHSLGEIFKYFVVRGRNRKIRLLQCNRRYIG